MNEEEIRKILLLLRPGDASDPSESQAREQAEKDPALQAWLREEQEFDRSFSRAFLGTPVPPGLKTKILAAHESDLSRRLRRSRRAAWIVAGIALLLAFFSSWRGPLTPPASLADFRGEMVSFVKVAPSLELETSHLERIQDWLGTEGAPASVFVPPGLEALQPLGCRVLFFRDHKVTLICFRRGDGSRLAHLLVVDGEALRALPSRENCRFAPVGEWMTAAWREGDRAYLLAAQGDRALLERYLHQSR